MPLQHLATPAALIDTQRMHANIQRMQQRMNALGVMLRPHVKTTKCLPIAQEQIAAGAQGITVSTLKEAEQFFVAGIRDILYAVGITPGKLPTAMALIQRGCALQLITDSLDSARHIADFGAAHHVCFDVLIEIDTDGHRSGVKPDAAELVDIAAALTAGGANPVGVLTHAGSSYELHERAALEALAEQERAGCVYAAQRLRAAGFACPVVSIGSTPTALSVSRLDGVTEVRAGVYVMFDLVMHNIGVCALSDIALSVLTTVIGHQREKGWVIVDAGWMAMSRDRGTARQLKDYGYGQVCDKNGAPVAGLTMSGANQEHGILSFSTPPTQSVDTLFPIGTQLRILPNHACATGAQFPEYQAIDNNGHITTWPRFYGW